MKRSQRASARRPWYPLGTKRLLLRPFTAGDAEAIQAYAGDPKVAQYMEWGPNTPAMTAKVLQAWLQEYQTWPRRSVELGIELRAQGTLIGGIRLSILDEHGATADIGYCLGRSYWGHGYATEAAGALLSVAFERLRLHRVYATCDVRNVASWRVMEKLGMRREGEFRADKLVKGTWRNSYLYAILAEEWLSR
ncbi:GNAT family N-acetyltransferase [Azospirillum argentinense]